MLYSTSSALARCFRHLRFWDGLVRKFPHRIVHEDGAPHILQFGEGVGDFQFIGVVLVVGNMQIMGPTRFFGLLRRRHGILCIGFG